MKVRTKKKKKFEITKIRKKNQLEKKQENRKEEK